MFCQVLGCKRISGEQAEFTLQVSTASTAAYKAQHPGRSTTADRKEGGGRMRREDDEDHQNHPQNNQNHPQLYITSRMTPGVKTIPLILLKATTSVLSPVQGPSKGAPPRGLLKGAPYKELL